MRNAKARAVIFNGDGSVIEFDSFTCCHCNSIVRVPARAAPTECGGWCGKCAKPTCRECGGSGRCAPFEAQLEAVEKGITEKLMRERFTNAVFGGSR